MKKKEIRLTILFFIIVWLGLGMLIDSHDLKDYTLHHIVVESVVERRTFALENSLTRELQPNGDVFKYKNHIYAIKQPGLALIGAVPYFVMNKLGIRYLNNYLQTSALITFFTSSLSIAIVAVAFLIVMYLYSKNWKVSIFLSSILVLTTTLFPYSGIFHHDTVATMLVFIGFCITMIKFHTQISSEYKLLLMLIVGILQGLGLFVSMLPVTIVLLTIIYVALHKSFKDIFVFIAGLSIGVLPILVFNYFVLGGFLHFPNIVGGAKDTYPTLSVNHVVNNFRRYFFMPGLSIIYFSPLVILATIGFTQMKKEYKLEKFLLPIMISIFLLHIASLQTVGHSQYGPRYLIPIMPFWYFGLVGLWNRKCDFCRWLRILILPLAIFSFLIFLPGVLWGTMYPTINLFPFREYLSRMNNLPTFPLQKLFLK